MLSEKNVIRLKEELQALLEELYMISSVGHFRNGREIQIYISNINSRRPTVT